MENKKIISWWSGGITSAVACKIALDLFKDKNECRVIMIDTQNEHPDTYRFKNDCEKWYGLAIEIITGIGEKYGNIFDVWRKHKSLNTATGAICSTNLKRLVREKWEKTNEFDHQVFGFEFDKKEINRALSMTMNHGKRTKAIYPLLMMGYDKKYCIKIVEDAGIEIPLMYQLGFQNNNCFNTGCVQGGIGYWQKMKRDFPDKFDVMADLEHELTELKGEPITMLKDQSNEAKEKMKIDAKSHLVFLKFNPKYPNNKTIDDMPQCKVEPLFECNGMCGINDLIPRSKTEQQLNFEF